MRWLCYPIRPAMVPGGLVSHHGNQAGHSESHDVASFPKDQDSQGSASMHSQDKTHIGADRCLLMTCIAAPACSMTSQPHGLLAGSVQVAPLFDTGL